MNTPATPDWEKEFDEKWPINSRKDSASNQIREIIKPYIRTLLTQSRLQYQKKLVERITKLGQQQEPDEVIWCVLDDVLALLKN